MLDVVLIGKLADVLEKEASLYEKFLSVEKGKTDVIINGDVSELEGMVKIEQSFLEKMQELEAERERIIELIALKSGINASDLTLTWIIENSVQLELVQANKLKSIRDKILRTVNELKRVDEHNSKLINNSLEYINFSINLITSANSAGSKYGNDGREGKEERRNFFDIKL